MTRARDRTDVDEALDVIGLQHRHKRLDRQCGVPESEDGAVRPMSFLRWRMFAHTAAASARVVGRFCGRGANPTEFADPLTWERPFEPVEDLRRGASMIPGQAVACACSAAVGVT